MAKEAEMKALIEASAAASDRARFVIFIIITASILVFCAMWNSWIYSWSNMRLSRAEDAMSLKSWIWNNNPASHGEDSARFFAAHYFITTRKIKDSVQLQILVQELQKTQAEDIMRIRVPFFGIVFETITKFIRM